MGRIASRIARVEPRRRARQLLLGLLSDLPRKNCWTIAEWAGDRTPDRMQHLLSRAKWDAAQVRDDVRGYVVAHLHDAVTQLRADGFDVHDEDVARLPRSSASTSTQFRRRRAACC